MTDIKCPKCNNVTQINASIDYAVFGCPQCKSVYDRYDNGTFKFLQNNSSISYPYCEIKVGSECTLEGVKYVVIGILTKKISVFLYTKEYTLLSDEGGYKYLSECEGHWIILEEDNKLDYNKFSPRIEFYYKDLLFRRYDSYNSNIISVEGFFDDTVKSITANQLEYICPPYIISTEKYGTRKNKTVNIFYGKHISKKEVKKIFSVNKIPSSYGFGLLHTFSFDMLSALKVFFATLIALFVLYMFNDKPKQIVLQTELSVNKYEKEAYVSPSFEVKDNVQTLEVDLYSDLDNSWAYVGVSVVNESTNEEEFTEQDIEYYHGSEGGESWSEGSQSEKFYMCGLEKGKYHLVITPSAEKTTNFFTDVENIEIQDKLIQVNVSLEHPAFYNLKSSFIILLLALGVMLGLNYLIEVWRWKDSSYSPYKSNDR